MATTVAKPADDIMKVWEQYKPDCTDKRLRNILMERYFPLVKYNGERIWQRLPDGVELDDLVSAGVFGLMDAIDAFDLENENEHIVGLYDEQEFSRSCMLAGRLVERGVRYVKVERHGFT